MPLPQRPLEGFGSDLLRISLVEKMYSARYGPYFSSEEGGRVLPGPCVVCYDRQWRGRRYIVIRVARDLHCSYATLEVVSGLSHTAVCYLHCNDGYYLDNNDGFYFTGMYVVSRM